MWLRKLVGYFLRGALVTAPLGLTLYLVLTVLTTLDRVLPVGIPGLGLLITLVLITAIGAFTSNVVGRSVLESTERFMSKVPLVKLVYNSIKDLIGAFVGDRKSFDRPVAVRPHREGELRLLGFVTRHSLGVLGMPTFVAVYLPQSYNFAGQLIVVPGDQVEEIDVPSGELMTFIVSGGVSGLGVGQSLLPPPPR
jgi:uncharacterized membrane protein